MKNKYVESLKEFSLDDFTSLTQEEKDEINLKVEIVNEIIQARKSKNITQQALEELSGVCQSSIARIENNSHTPNLATLLKILRPLGKTLGVVDIPLEKEANSLKA